MEAKVALETNGPYTSLDSKWNARSEARFVLENRALARDVRVLSDNVPSRGQVPATIAEGRLLNISMTRSKSRRRGFPTRAGAVASLALLGSFAMPIASADGLSPAAQKRQVPPGLWGGEHVRMIVSRTGALLEYDCASGKIDRPIIVDVRGGFNTQGSYASEHGGPRREGDADLTRARYVGRVTGDTMRLTVTLERTEKPVGVFTLTRGNDPLLTKCG